MKPFGLILAAGASTRFGSEKWSALYQGERLLDHAVETMTTAGITPLVVSGAFELPPHFETIYNPSWETGIGTSIARGVQEARRRGATTVVIAAMDQPRVTADDLCSLVEACVGDGAASAAYDNIRGIPACFSKAWFPQLELLTTTGAQFLIRDDPRVVEVAVPNAAFDIDYVSDLLD